MVRKRLIQRHAWKFFAFWSYFRQNTYQFPGRSKTLVNLEIWISPIFYPIWESGFFLNIGHNELKWIKYESSMHQICDFYEKHQGGRKRGNFTLWNKIKRQGYTLRNNCTLRGSGATALHSIVAPCSRNKQDDIRKYRRITSRVIWE